MKQLLIFLSLTIFTFSCKSQKTDSDYSVPLPSLASAAQEKMNNVGLEEGLEWLEKNKNAKEYKADENELNALGYQLIYDIHDASSAQRVFTINMELFPASANVYDSAGEAYLVSEDYDKSVMYYRKSMELSGEVLFNQLGYLPSMPYVPTTLPLDVKDLFVSEGNWNNEIAFVYVQGGPDLQLNIGQRDGLHLMRNEDSLLKIYPYQAQMLNPQSLACNPSLTKEEANFENAQSVEILDRVITHLVEKKKRVFLIGHSYGASISMEYVHSKKNKAEKVVLMGLDLDEDVSSWSTLKRGEYIRWKNGDQPYTREVFSEIPIDHPLRESFSNVTDNLTLIVINNMEKKYTSLYSDADFNRTISVFSNLDEANGRKSKEEKEILFNKGVTVVEINGDHHDMLTTAFMTALYEHLVHKTPLLGKY